MPKSVIMPALGMAQESGTLISWLKQEGDPVVKGEPLMEIETDKATVEMEAPASGFLGGILAQAGDVIPVGQTIAWILAAGEQLPTQDVPRAQSNSAATPPRNVSVEISPLARKIAEEHAIDPGLIKSNGKRVEKADVLAYIDATRQAKPEPASTLLVVSVPTRLKPASPKARRLATERGVDIETIKGSGPDGAVLIEDVPLEVSTVSPTSNVETPGTVWRIMAERMTASWTTVPHFYLVREVDASQLIEWRTRISATVEKRTGIKPTYTDLLVKLLGFVLQGHPRLNATWADGSIQSNPDVNVGIAVAVEDGLIVPVVRHADRASVSEIAAQRNDLVERAQNRKVRPADISGATFTLSNLGMYNVDAFNAIVNTPQAAILAVGRIAERVVPIKGQVAIRPMLVMTLSCDHRVVDGARAAQFLEDLTIHMEDPWRLLT
jgi:pyruvate dehydrogenase E2 component (dihydrolipoamide acetyltransferase)